MHQRTYQFQLFAIAAASATLYAQGTTFNPSDRLSPQGTTDNTTWSHFAGNARRQGTAWIANATPSLSSPAWIASGNGIITYIPIAQTGLVVDRTRVYALVTNPAQPGSSFAIAYDRFTGTFQWATPIPSPLLDSWSTPAIDFEHDQLIIAIGDRLLALDLSSGNQSWSTPIGGIIVNASPAITTDQGNTDRTFITNYSFGGGTPAKLTCINIDPFNPTINPYQPGEIVWQTLLNGDSSGNTPAYTNATVFVATASSPGSQAGLIHAFDATATAAPSPIWTFTNTINAGFFSGVSVAHGHVYASSYNFSGLQFNSNTIKLNKETGQLVWSVPTNRTDTSPIPLPNGDVIVSGGIPISTTDALPFFGTLPSIEYIDNASNSATLRWDSAADTLDDQNNNGFWDRGESFRSLGGWTHQPIAYTINNTPMLLVGTLPQTTITSFIGHNTDIAMIDLTKYPTQPGFIVEEFSGTGSTPAMAGAWIYTPGAQGIHAFAPNTVLTPKQLIGRYTQGKITLDELIKNIRK